MHPIVRSVQLSQLKKVPSVKAGYTVRVSQKIKEGEKERIQRFEGLVIKVGHGEGVEKTFTVRKIVEGIGVEKVFPFHSPNITEIKVVKKAKVRRSKLYYMRERSGKSARLIERQVSDQERLDEMTEVESSLQMKQAVQMPNADEQTLAPAEENAEQVVAETAPLETPETEETENNESEKGAAS